jgi:uncharacterized damage-inducible protein DinB
VTEFNTDKQQLLGELESSRGELRAVVDRLSADDLAAARRGSWTISRVLDHVLHSEKLYTQLISVFSGGPASVIDSSESSRPEEFAAALDRSREVFLTAVNKVQEDDFYRLQTIGREEYSVLSILENNAAHDLEHAEQIRKTLDQS